MYQIGNNYTCNYITTQMIKIFIPESEFESASAAAAMVSTAGSTAARRTGST